MSYFLTTKYRLLIGALFFSFNGLAQQTVQVGGYRFQTIRDMESGTVENQGKTGTCWSFSGISFFQAEALRIGKGTGLNLSEMFVVRNMYPLKADNFIRMHGKAQFGDGGEFTDDLLCLKQFGLVPQSVYDGNRKTVYEDSALVHRLDSLVKKVAGSAGPIYPLAYKAKVNKLLNQYMGAVPQTFTYEGKTYDAASFAKAQGLNADDYVLLTSFSHHPFYQPFVLEVPDNWNWQQMYNVPLNDLCAIAENALQKGYTVAWSAGVNDFGFNFNAGLAVVPDSLPAKVTQAEYDRLFKQPFKEKIITQEMRQQAFDDYETQDDHGMHIVGLAKDQSGKYFFRVKNSWGTGHNAQDGYFYASEPYFAYKTTNIMVNKKALPKDIAKKLEIKI